MDIIRLIGVAMIELPYYLLSSKYDYSRFWNKCIRINTLYTKVLQAIAVNYMSDDFYFHFNNIPYTESEVPEIKHITPTRVIGSGMISIVYEGVHEGKTYVIKTKRNGIDEKVINGLQQLKNMIYWIKFLPYMYVFNIDYMFNQFEHTMLSQLSFDTEIKNHKKFIEINAYTDTIFAPILYEEYCTSTQIVMSKIEGTHYTDIPGELRDKFAKELVEMTAKNLIIDGFIHSDLHAGNIIFTPENKIGIIDFGLVMKLTTKDKQCFFDVLKHMSIYDYDTATKHIITNFLSPDHIKLTLTNNQYNELHRSLSEKLHSIYSITKQFTMKDIRDIIHVTNKYKLNIATSFYNLMFFILSCESLITKMSPIYVEIFIEKIKGLTEFDD